LTHQGGGTNPTAGDVADDECCATRAEVDRVVPVSPDPRPLNAGLIEGRDLQVYRLHAATRQKTPLEGIGDLMLTLGGLPRGSSGGDRLLCRTSLGDVLEKAAQAGWCTVLVGDELTTRAQPP